MAFAAAIDAMIPRYAAGADPKSVSTASVNVATLNGDPSGAGGGTAGGTSRNRKAPGGDPGASILCGRVVSRERFELSTS